MSNEELYKNLTIILKMFKNRPHHLAKYLIDNSAFNKKFIEKIINSNKLKDMSDDEINNISFPPDSSKIPVYFIDISQMNEFYNSIIDDGKLTDKNKSIEDITKELNIKLDIFLKEEKYEDAAKVRDYMSRNNIKRINNF